MAYLTKTLNFYKLVKPSFLSFSNKLRVVAQRPCTCYSFTKSAICSTWNVKVSVLKEFYILKNKQKSVACFAMFAS